MPAGLCAPPAGAGGTGGIPPMGIPPIGGGGGIIGMLGMGGNYCIPPIGCGFDLPFVNARLSESITCNFESIEPPFCGALLERPIGPNPPGADPGIGFAGRGGLGSPPPGRYGIGIGRGSAGATGREPGSGTGRLPIGFLSPKPESSPAGGVTGLYGMGLFIGITKGFPSPSPWLAS